MIFRRACLRSFVPIAQRFSPSSPLLLLLLAYLAAAISGRRSRLSEATGSVAGLISALLLLAALSPPAHAQAPNWVQNLPATTPSGGSGYGYSMVYDAALGQAFLIDADGYTWLWNGVNWTQQFPTSSPGARLFSQMDYDSVNQQVVLFGGCQDCQGSNLHLDDTWLWTGNKWVQQTGLTEAPTGRYLSAMAYDPAHQQSVLFGGADSTGAVGDTWLWNGTSWTQVNPSPNPSPSPRYGHVMAYLPTPNLSTPGQVVLFGGDASGNVLGDTWLWNGTTWTQPSLTTNPPARTQATLAYDAALGQLVLFGGYEPGLGSAGSDTWLWNGTTWTQANPGPNPPARLEAAMAYDSAIGQMVLFGGSGQLGFLTDTWSYEAPTTLTVTSAADDGSAETLRTLIAAAAADDTVVFAPSLSGQTITLDCADPAFGTIVLSQNVTIAGPGANNLAISGNNACTVFQVNSGVTATISGLTIENGQSQTGAGINNAGVLTVSNSNISGNSAQSNGGGDGGGIYNNSGTVTVSNSNFSGNSAQSEGGGIFNNSGMVTVSNSTFSINSSYYGGGIYSYFGTVAVSNSTFSGNHSTQDDGQGGGIFNGGTITVSNSTFSGNSASTGGGIYNYGTLTLSNSTFSRNSASYQNQGGALFNFGYGDPTVTFKGVLMANNGGGNSCYNLGTLISDGYNLEDGTTCNFTQATDQSSVTSAASFLGLLQYNGGPTQTIALRTGSTAIDAIPLSACTDAFGNPVITDQRGIYRPQGSGCDIGAYELQQNLTANVCPNGQTSPAPCSTAVTLQYYVPSGTTLSSTNPVQVVTQGAAGLDFTQIVVNSCGETGGANGRNASNCSLAPRQSARRSAKLATPRASAQPSGAGPDIISIGGPCSNGLQGPAYCDVQVAFTPLFPGVRLGASTLLDSKGNTVASYPLSGLGQAPLVAFPQGPQTTVVDSVAYPLGLAFDGSGNLFVSSFVSETSAAVVEFPAAGGQTTLATDVLYPGGIAVDGAGNVFVADGDNNRLAEFSPGGVETIAAFPGLHLPTDVFVDGSGDLFVADYDNSRIVEEPAGCQTGVCQTTIASQANFYPGGVALDASGNLFTNDGTSTVYELPVGGTLTPLGTDFSNPTRLRLDAAENVFVADVDNGRVAEIPAGCSTNTCQLTTGGGLSYPTAVVTDGAGNLYIADNGNNRIVKVNRSQPPALNSFASTTVGQTSQPQTFIVQNAGNGPLTFSSIVASGNFTVDSGSTTCSTSTPLAVGGICTVGVDFAPTNSGPLTGTLTLSDNSLNTGVATSPGAAHRNKSNGPALPPATQVLSLQGNGVQNTVHVTVSTNITGPSMSVDGGTAFTGSQQFIWTVGTQHTFSTTSPQTPTAGTEYTFANWPDASTNPASDTVTASTSVTSYTATFNTLYKLTTAASPSNGGSVSPASGSYYASGTPVSLGATANTGYKFSSWTGGVANSGSASTSITMNAPQSVTANFVVNNVSLTIATAPAGLKVSVDGGTAQTAPLHENWQVGSHHTLATTTPQTATGTKFTFTSWSDNGALSHSITVPSSAATYTANFATSYLLTTAASPSAGGTVTPPSGSYYASGTKVNLTAKPKTNYVFSKWTGSVAGATSPSTTVTMNAPESVTADFSTAPVTVSPVSISFGNVPLGQKKKQDVTLKNTTTKTIALDSITLSVTAGNASQFSLVRYCGSKLAAAVSCTVAVIFTPDAVGSDAATLTIVTSAPGSPIAIPITAAGVK